MTWCPHGQRTVPSHLRRIQPDDPAARELPVAPPDKLAEIARRYQAGETQTAIASTVGVDRSVARRVLEQLGVERRTNYPASGPHEENILRMHDEGKSIKEIGTTLGVNSVTVYRALRRAGRVQKKRW